MLFCFIGVLFSTFIQVMVYSELLYTCENFINIKMFYVLMPYTCVLFHFYYKYLCYPTQKAEGYRFGVIRPTLSSRFDPNPGVDGVSARKIFATMLLQLHLSLQFDMQFYHISKGYGFGVVRLTLSSAITT